MKARRNFLLSAAAAPLLWSHGNVFANAEPTRVLVGFPPGGSTDAVARAFAKSIRPAFPQEFVVENRTGASGRIAARGMKGARDSRSILFTPDFVLVVYPHLFSNNGYDIFTDFAPIGTVVRSDYILVAGPAVPKEINNPKDYLKWVASNPSQNNAFGSSGPGSTLHFAGEMLAKASGVPLRYVPYKGGAPALIDLAGGHIPATVNTVGESIELIRSGKVRAIGCFGEKRSRFLPEVPTMVESGYKNVVVDLVFFALMPAGAPDEDVQKLSKELLTFGSKPSDQAVLNSLCMEVATSTPAQLKTKLEAGYQYWKKEIASTGFKMEDEK